MIYDNNFTKTKFKFMGNKKLFLKQKSNVDYGIFLIYIIINIILFIAILYYSSNEKLDFLIYKFNLPVFILLILYKIFFKFQYFRFIRNEKLYKELSKSTYHCFSGIEHLCNSINNLQSCLTDLNEIINKGENEKNCKVEKLNLTNALTGLNETITKLITPVSDLSTKIDTIKNKIIPNNGK